MSEDFCNDPKCALNKEGEKHLKDAHRENFYKSIVKKKNLLDPNTNEYFIKFQLPVYWIEGGEITDGIIQDEKESDIGQFDIGKAGIGKSEILIIDSFGKLIIKTTKRSVWRSAWDVKDSEDNVVGRVKFSAWHGLSFYDKNDNKVLILDRHGLTSEINEPSGKPVAEFSYTLEDKIPGLKSQRRHTYHLKVLDKLYDRKVLLGYLLTFIKNNTGGDFENV